MCDIIHYLIDGLWIRSLLLAFFFKVLPEVIEDGRLYIAEPPLYRINDKKNPFVINTMDYLDRYVTLASKEYKVGYKKNTKSTNVEWFDKKMINEFLDDTKTYVKTIQSIVNYLKLNDRLLEIVLEECVIMGINKSNYETEIKNINIQHLMNRVGSEFNELYFDDHDQIIKGSICTKWQELDIHETVSHSVDLLEPMNKWMAPEDGCIVLKNIKNGDEHNLSLLGTLKILQKYQPDILHRFKGLSENDAEDMKLTIMDPNTRSLIKVNMGIYENDMEIFQILRGTSPAEMAQRKSWMSNFEISKEDIDT